MKASSFHTESESNWSKLHALKFGHPFSGKTLHVLNLNVKFLHVLSLKQVSLEQPVAATRFYLLSLALCVQANGETHVKCCVK